MKAGARRALVFLAALVVASALGEVAARLLLPAPQRVLIEPAPGYEARMRRERAAPSEVALRVHPEEGGLYVETKAGRRLRANARVTIENHSLSKRRIEIATNSLGYRNREIGEKTGTRVLFLGDSITFGDYVAEEETFVRVVEGQLRAGGGDWETVNAGVGGISIANELAILVETGLALEPDAVVVGFYLNDFRESPGVHAEALPGLLGKSRLLHHLRRTFSKRSAARPGEVVAEGQEFDPRVWLDEFDREWPSGPGDFRRDRPAFNALIKQHFGDWGGAWSAHTWAHAAPMIEELARLAEIHDFELLLLAFPVREQVVAEFLYDYPQERLRGLADRFGLPLLDVLPILRHERAEAGQKLFYDRCHHTPYANAAIATAITAFLRENLER